ncbi:MAG: alpha/beta hydrolase [Bowdeniella nasicola]|nr:alpha/beta hydrolase [Bowdeniella nasicola]
MLTSFDPLFATGPWEHRSVDAHGARFHVVGCGDLERADRIVLLLHSYPQHWYAWRSVLPAAAELGYPVYAVDLRGYGASDKPPRQFATPVLSADILGIVSSLGASEAILVGHGLGGVVARGAAAKDPGRVRHVVAVSSPHPARWSLPLGHLSATRWLTWVQLPYLPERSHTRGSAVARFVTSLASPESPAVSALETYARALRSPFAAHCAMEQIRWLVRSRHRPTGRGFLAALERAAYAVPVTEVRGRSDGLWDPTLFDTSALISQAGHFLPEEDPALVTEAIAGAVHGAFGS